MTPEEYQRLQSIFERVLACDEESREETLDRECGDDEALRRNVEALLACAGEPTAALKDCLSPASPFLDSVSEDVPRQIGPYRVLRRLGTGGMGTVFEAQQDRPKRSVALKVLRRGDVLGRGAALRA